MSNLFPSPAGEWKAQFDPRFTSRGVFYLDDQQMVDVEVMEDAKHPLSSFIDNELEAQVKNNNSNNLFLKCNLNNIIAFLVREVLRNMYFIPSCRSRDSLL